MEIGTKLYEYRGSGPKSDRHTDAVEFTVTKVTKTQFTTDDGRRWALGDSWAGRHSWRLYGGSTIRGMYIHDTPGGSPVTTEAALTAAREQKRAEAKVEADAARAALIAEHGIFGAIKKTLEAGESWAVRIDLRAIRESLPEDKQAEYIEYLEDAICDAYRAAKSNVERFTQAAERITQIVTDMTAARY